VLWTRRAYRGAEGELGLASVEEHGARLEGVGGESAGKRVEEGGLAGAGRAHERGERAGLGVPGELVEHGLRLAGPQRHGDGEVLPRQPRRHVAGESGGAGRGQRLAVAPQRLAERAQAHDHGAAGRRRVGLQLSHGLPGRGPPCVAVARSHRGRAAQQEKGGRELGQQQGLPDYWRGRCGGERQRSQEL
jgi:hypothetical protein